MLIFVSLLLHVVITLKKQGLHLDAFAFRLALHVLSFDSIVSRLALLHQVVVEASSESHRLLVLALKELKKCF